MKRVSSAVAGLLASIFWWTAAGAVETNIGPQFRGWDGFYVGASGGIVRGTARWTDDFFGFTTGDFSSSGMLFGLTAGKNWQNGRWVYGIEGDWSLVDFRADSYAIVCAPAGCTSEMTSFATLRGRLGYLFTPNLLVFATAGAAWADLTHGNIVFSVTTNTVSGHVAGAGLEWAVAPQWTLKAEYLFARFDGNEACSVTVCFVSIQNDKFDAHIFRLGMNWHFGQGGAPLFAVAAAVSGNSWTGFYAGAFFGYTKAETEWSDPTFGLMSGSFSGDSAIGGLTAGFNWQSGLWIYGVEGDAAFLNITANSAGSFCLCFPAETRISELVTLRSRLGYLVQPNILVFASGGVAAGLMKFGNFGIQTGSSLELGPAVGAGIEVQTLRNWTIKGEYLFASFSSSEACNALLCGGALYSDYIRVHMFRFGINRYF